MTLDFTNIKNWPEVEKGVYRYVISAGACYEIILMYWAMDTDILTSKANLYITGEWSSKNNGDYFSRELLLEDEPFFECMRAAQKDYDENVN